MSHLSCYPTLAVLLESNPERAHALLQCLELALLSENDTRIRQSVQWASALSLRVEDLLPQIPEIPATILLPRGELNLLTLVPFHLGNVQLAGAAGLKYQEYGHTDETLVPVDKTRYDFSKYGWRWVLANDGSRNLDRRPSDCLLECVGERFAGVDKVGIAIHFIHGKRGHVMDLPASVHANERQTSAVVDPIAGPRLDAHDRGNCAYPGFGTVFFVFV